MYTHISWESHIHVYIMAHQTNLYIMTYLRCNWELVPNIDILASWQYVNGWLTFCSVYSSSFACLMSSYFMIGPCSARLYIRRILRSTSTPLVVIFYL